LNLYTKIFFSFFVVALIPFYVLLYYTYENNHDMLMKKYNLLQEKKLQEKALLMREDLKEMERELEFLASLNIMDDLISDDADKRILSVLDSKRSVFKLNTQLSVKDVNGICVASTNRCIGTKDSLMYKKEIFASFDKNKVIGTIELQLPYNSLKYYFKNESDGWRLNNKIGNNKAITNSIGYGINLSLLLKKETLDKSFHILQKQLIAIAIFSFLAFLALIVVVSRAIAKPIAQNQKLQEQKLHLQSSQLLLLEKAKHLAQTKARFISQMSHEFRTPLNSIIGFSQFLDQERLVEREYEKLPKNIEKAGKHLLEMVNQILDYAKAQSEHLTLDMKEINLKTLLKEVSEIMTPLSEKKLLELTCNCEEIIILSDKKMLTNILLNLIANAIKFTHNGYIKINAFKDKKVIKICIEDSGIGMSEEESKKLFEPFSRLESAKKIEGTGLGLALCMSYAQLLNAELVYEPKETGSKFILSLKADK